MGYPIWIYTVDLNGTVSYFSWDCPVCENNVQYARTGFVGTHFNEDYSLGVF